MGNVLRAVKRDYKRLFKAPLALTVISVLLILPAFYTWINVYAFWDIYNNLGGVPICVVDEDEGASSDLTGYINIGDMVIDQLKENTELGWEFVDKETALQKVESGSAYAAFVFPSNFTQDLLDVLDGKIEHPKMEYYVNEKVSAISPKIGDQAASTLQTTINGAVVSAVSNAVATAYDSGLEEAAGSLNQENAKALNTIDTAQTNLGDVRTNLADLNNTIAEVQQKTTSAQSSLANARADIKRLSNSLADVSTLTGNATNGVTQLSSRASSAFAKGSLNITTAASKTNSKISQVSGVISDVSAQVGDSVSVVTQTVEHNKKTIEQLKALADLLPEGEAKTAVLNTVTVLETNNAKLQTELDELNITIVQSGLAAQSIDAASATANTLAQNAVDASNEYATKIYSETIPQINQQISNLTQVSTSLSNATAQLNSLVDQTDNVLTELNSTLNLTKEAISQTDTVLGDVQTDLDAIHTDLAALNSSQTVNNLASELYLDADTLSDFLGAPVELNSTAIFPLDNYGAAMVPLFANITIWIGIYMLVIILRVEMDDEDIKNFTMRQRFCARFLFLAPLAIIQACICMAGCVYGLHVQTSNIPIFFITAIVTALAYLGVEYTLAALLQHVGKGICVVLIYAQITGSASIYPIELTAKFFRDANAWFPMTYSVNAFRQAIAGFYQSEWIQAILILVLFGVVFFAIGLWLRPYTSNANRVFAKQIEESDILNGEESTMARVRFKVSQLYAALADRTEFSDAIYARLEKFNRMYPKLLWGGLIVGVVVPVALAFVFAALGIDKAILLTVWFTWLVVVLVFMVVVEDIRFSMRNQSLLKDLSDDEIRELSSADGQLGFVSAPSLPLMHDAVAAIKDGKHRMGNTLRLFCDDFRRLFSNVVTIVVITGLVLMPSPFCWYNVLGCWNAFNNMNQLKIAVASVDEGYTSDLLPVEINIGDRVESALRENDDIDWVFTDKDAVLEGVKSGEYYAAVVVPENFSKCMLTFYSDDAEHASLDFYYNEGKNAIGAIFTDEAADTVVNQVNTAFVGVVSDVSLSLADSLNDYLVSADASSTIGDMASHLNQVGTQFKTGGNTLSTYASAIGSAASLVDGSASLLDNTLSSVDSVKSTAAQGKTSADSISNTVAQANAALKLALQKTTDGYDDTTNAIINAFDQSETLGGDTSGILRNQATKVYAQASKFTALANKIRALKPSVPEASQQVLEALALQMDASAAEQTRLGDKITSGADSIDTKGADAQAVRDEIVALAQQSKASIEDLNAYYKTNTEPIINDLANNVAQTAQSLSGSTVTLRSSADDLVLGSNSVTAKLRASQSKLIFASGKLIESGNKLIDLGNRLNTALSSDDISTLRSILASDPSTLSNLIAAPVQVERQAIFPAHDYGSQMTPFYATLGLWIGALLSVVAIKPKVSERAQARLKNPKPHQLYLGRFGVFAFVALCQSTIMALGNLFFLGVQANDPLLFFISYWVASLVFTFIMYTLVVSMANMGKVVGVLLLVLQITAAGGTYPLQMLPPIFTTLNPLVPATHCINAMREAMFGVYANNFCFDICRLLVFLIPALILGLALRKPFQKFVAWYVRKAEESKVIV